MLFSAVKLSEVVPFGHVIAATGRRIWLGIFEVVGKGARDFCALLRFCLAASMSRDVSRCLKVLGTASDYYVAEGTLGASEPTPVALPGSPDDDVEPRGQGANVRRK